MKTENGRVVYDVGDIVVPINKGNITGIPNPGWVDDMLGCVGHLYQIVRVSKQPRGYLYRIEAFDEASKRTNYHWTWAGEWFMPFQNEDVVNELLEVLP